MTLRITSKQCKSARSLLKWNIHDLASRTNVLSKRIDNFEKGMCHLHQPENDDIVRVYVEAGIEFRSDFEVVLADPKRNTDLDFKDSSGAIVKLDMLGNIISDTSSKTYKALDNLSGSYVVAPGYSGPDRRSRNSSGSTGSKPGSDYKGPDRRGLGSILSSMLKDRKE